MSNEYIQGVSILPWFNPENRRKALIAAMKAENHLGTMEIHSYSPEIYEVERRRLHAQVGQVTKLWNQDMQEWLLDRVKQGLTKELKPV